VNFKNTVIIMTSNLGSEVFQRASGTEEEKVEEVLSALRKAFRPEFVNRIDDIVVFHPLRREHIRSIVDVQLKRLAKRLAEKRITVELTDAARDLLAEHGFDPTYGARPLKRAIQRMVLDPLAMEILQGRVVEGSTVEADVADGALAFKTEVSEAA
jgi:ATP-dependent Clp protease ATP-binding subunit ClpB